MQFLIELTHNRARVFRIELGSRLLMAILILGITYLTFKSFFNISLDYSVNSERTSNNKHLGNKDEPDPRH